MHLYCAKFGGAFKGAFKKEEWQMKVANYLAILMAGQLWVVSATAGDYDCHAPVSAHENQNVTHGDFSAAVKFTEVKLTPTTVGFGAAANRADEITVIDGELFLVRGDNGSLEARHQPNHSEGAVVLVTGSPIAWNETGKIDGVSSFDGLNFALDNAVDDMKCDERAVVPFKIVGHAKSVNWTVVNGSNKEINNANHDVDVVVAGIYSKTDKEHLHMVKGYNLHAHVYFPKLGVAGHIQEIDLEDGGMLYLPAAK